MVTDGLPPDPADPPDPPELLRGQERFLRHQLEPGGARAEWVRGLPALVAACEGRWSIRVGEPFPGLSYNFVAPATRADGAPAVLKLSPEGEVRPEEVDALRLFDGRGACRLLEVDEAQGCLLLERVLPGTELRTLTDDEGATRIAAEVMRRLWRPVPAGHRLETLEERAAGFDRLRAAFGGQTGPFPRRLVERAEAVFRDFPRGVEPVVLHGDCHHYNILLARDRRGAPGGEEWVAIDPHGVVGDPGYEVGAFIYNPSGHLDPLAQPDPGRFVERRVAVLAESLGWDRERVRGWCIAQAVLSSWWTYEDHARFDPATLVVAAHLERLEG
jgi:streptomycin 6-kinase